MPSVCIAVDDLDVVRAGLVSLQLTHPTVIRSMTAYADVSEVDLALPAPDIVVLDYWLGAGRIPCLDHVPALRTWGAKVVLYTTEETPVRLQAAMRAEVDGLSRKVDGLDALVETIRTVSQGTFACSSPLARAALDDSALGARLTPTEVKVLRALASGREPKHIAEAWTVSVKTVNTHIEHIRAKYAGSTGGAVNRARMLWEGELDGYLDTSRRTRDDGDPGIA